jgi:hypothetical protein
MWRRAAELFVRPPLLFAEAGAARLPIPSTALAVRQADRISRRRVSRSHETESSQKREGRAAGRALANNDGKAIEVDRVHTGLRGT